MLHFLAHDKSINVHKITDICDGIDKMGSMIALRDYLDSAISKGQDMVHDAVASSCVAKGSLSMDLVVKKIEIQKAMKENEM